MERVRGDVRAPHGSSVRTDAWSAGSGQWVKAGELSRLEIGGRARRVPGRHIDPGTRDGVAVRDRSVARVVLLDERVTIAFGAPSSSR